MTRLTAGPRLLRSELARGGAPSSGWLSGWDFLLGISGTSFEIGSMAPTGQDGRRVEG